MVTETGAYSAPWGIEAGEFEKDRFTIRYFTATPLWTDGPPEKIKSKERELEISSPTANAIRAAWQAALGTITEDAGSFDKVVFVTTATYADGLRIRTRPSIPPEVARRMYWLVENMREAVAGEPDMTRRLEKSARQVLDEALATSPDE